MNIISFKTLKHNFWTPEDHHRLYEGNYYPLTSKEIGVKFFKNKSYIRVTVPYAVENWYKNFNMLLSEYPQNINTLLEKWSDMQKGPTKESLERKMILDVQRYFVKKINITQKQAKALMKFDLGTKTMSSKQVHQFHKKIGLE